MEYKSLIQKLGFLPKENTSGVFCKEYAACEGYTIEVNFDKSVFNFGKLIVAESKTTQNFSQAENWVVLECVDKLLEKGYQPNNIILEKTWATGHGTSGRLDILITRNDGTAYMMIECKTYGVEFDKEYKKILKDGGQLFTYFQQDKNAEILMLYGSELDKKGSFHHKNEIIKIEDDYRQAGNVKDFYDRWNKLPKNNGVFEEWVKPYDFKSKALTPKSLKEIKQEDSSFIFNRFLEILRHNVVSDKPNAFNKIFTLFLCKIYDEKSTRNSQELSFQWLEGLDNNISFQKRLADLYKKGMKEFLEKEVSDLSDSEFEEKFGIHILDEDTKRKILEQFTEIRLKKNNEFAIKEVFDDVSFEDNAKVVKEVVELLQGYKIRYTKRHQYFSDFFELLLTTGLKQESGQFFTPVPIAQFIIKSIPLDMIVLDKLSLGEADNLLPSIIDYASGSGHFLTESMHEIQRILDREKTDDYIDKTAIQIKKWQLDHFDWAIHYVYGIEKDYRLVKVGKVGCYLHGDGLAKVIHGDGLANFTQTKEYQGKLNHRDKYFSQDNKQFDIVISNPPYSVSAFKGTLKNVETDFDLYNELTDQSSQIECLFIERTKQLLKDGGIAGIILPSSILSNAGIYTKAREIILQYFEILAIAELGSNTFMATGTNTVTLFLRRRKNEVSQNIKSLVDRITTNSQDVNIGGVEKPVSKYVSHVWESISYNDYITLLQKQPNDAVKNHEIYNEYQNRIAAKSDAEKWNIIIQKEQEKVFYFILSYSQEIVLVKSGEKNEEKQFLGYEFSNRRGSEGIHPVQRGKSIDESTKLFDTEIFDNPEKASTYIYKAFQGDFKYEIDDSLQQHISRHNLIDMLTFDRVDFEKNVSLSAKKKIKIDTKWDLAKIGDIAEIVNGGTPDTKNQDYWDGDINWATLVDTKTKYLHGTERKITLEGVNKSGAVILPINTVIFSSRATIGDVCINKVETCTNQGYKNFICKPEKIHYEYLYIILKNQAANIASLASGMTYAEISKSQISEFKIPLPDLDTQKSIISEIEILDVQEKEAKELIDDLTKAIFDLVSPSATTPTVALKNLLEDINPEKGKVIKDLDPDTKVSFLAMPDVSNEAEIVNLQQRSLKDVRNGFTFFQPDDVLLAKITPCMENGKGALVVQLENDMGFGSTEFFVLRSDRNKILPKLLFYITKDKKFRFSAEKVMTGASGHRRVPKSFIETYKVPNFSIAQQQEIINQIESIETKILSLKAQILKIPLLKEQTLRKFL